MQHPLNQKMNEYRTRNQSSTIFGQSITEQKDAEKIFFGNVSSRKPAPECIPKLSLDSLIGHDDLTYSKVHKVIEFPVSKDSSSMVNDKSWQVKQTCSQKEANFSHSKYDDIPDLELNLSQSNDVLGNLAKAAKKVKDDLRIDLKNKLANGNMKEERLSKAKVAEESIMNNQLNRFKVEDEKPPTELPKFGFNEKFDARSKRHQDMYQSRAVLQNAEDDNSKRLRFSSRIISIDGQNARREINGIFFVSDNSLTMYEFRQFGNRSNALPFIQRGCYNHLKGCLKGELYCLFDICIGKDLLFETSLQATLPDSLKKRSIAVFRITDVDEEVKKKYLYDGKKRNEVEQDMMSYETKLVDEKIKIACKIRARICKQLQTRGPRTLVNLHHHFMLTDKLHVGLLNQEEVKAALSKFRIIINDEEFEDLWRITDTYQDNRVDFLDFSRAFIGEMSEIRKFWVRKAFSKIDANRTGCGKLSDIKKFYLPKNSSVVKGNISETDLINDLTQSSKLDNDDYVSYSLFEAYYEGVNLGIDADEEFMRLIRSCWTI